MENEREGLGVKVLSLAIIPLIGWILTISGSLSSHEEKLNAVDLRVQTLEKHIEAARSDIQLSTQLLSELKTSISWIRAEIDRLRK